MKRSRGDAPPADAAADDADAPDPRASARERFPRFTARASSAISIVVGDAPPFAPAFTHQQFIGETIWGYESPQLLLSYTDPDLRFAGAFSADAAAPAEAEVDGERLPPPDDVAECVRTSVPIGARLAIRVGAGGVAPVAQLPPYSPAPDAEVLTVPPGRCVAAYRDAATSRDFVIHTWILDTPALRAYHDRMAGLAAWGIETASPVDLEDPRWVVFGLYELCAAAGAPAAPAPAVAFAGYATVYRFTNPTRRARPTALRLAQLLLLPRFQRRGHGRRVLEAVHAAAVVEDAYEVTIESPCEGMCRLRDARDVGEAARRGLLPALHQPAPDADGPPQPPPLRELPPALTPDELEALRLALRCTAAQARRVVEALTLARLPRRAAADPDAAADAVFTAYRVSVKRRIYATDADVRAITDADARKAALEELFRDAHAEYAAALAACGLMPRDEAGTIVSARAEQLRRQVEEDEKEKEAAAGEAARQA